jgi:hypothetical protein
MMRRAASERVPVFSKNGFKWIFSGWKNRSATENRGDRHPTLSPSLSLFLSLLSVILQRAGFYKSLLDSHKKR